MGLLSRSVSITRYKVEGELEKPIIETITSSLKNNAISTIDDSEMKSVGWTSFKNPYAPLFTDSSFVMGSHIVFSLRIDKKNIPTQLVQKYYHARVIEKLAEAESDNEQKQLSRSEKKAIKESIIDMLSQRIPATPSIYDIVWNCEESLLFFFSSLKTANEELETLFSKSFNLSLIKLFPYTIADLTLDISNSERDVLSELSPTKFTD